MQAAKILSMVCTWSSKLSRFLQSQFYHVRSCWLNLHIEGDVVTEEISVPLIFPACNSYLVRQNLIYVSL